MQTLLDTQDSKASTYSTPLNKTKKAKSHPVTVTYKPAKGLRKMQVLILLGIFFTGHFLWWFADEKHIGFAPLFWLLVISLGFKMLRMLHEWYHYMRVAIPNPLPAPSGTYSTVDILTTACPGEPREMIVRTLQAIQAITYPHTSYLCDEGNDPYLREVCAKLGVVHVTRQVKVDAKAGNINNALRQATGEFCVVLDPDHVPTPNFLDQVLPYFQDPAIGFVQVVQAYGNQQESLVARGAAEQTYHFYGPLMMGMNSYGTAQAIGANCTFRRAALDSIGGHAAGLTEDMHTAMRLHAQGWKSVYAPVIVSRGLVPSSLAAYYAQQLKWSRGCFDLLFHVYPRLFSKFTWRQRLHYFTLPLHFFSGVVALIDILVPILALVMAQIPWHVPILEFVWYLFPVTIISLLIRLYAQRWLRDPQEKGLHLAGGLLRVGTWWIYTLGFLYAIFRIKVPYIPTPKEGEERNEWRIALPNILVALISIAAAKYGMILIRDPYTRIMFCFAILNACILLMAAFMGQHIMVHNLIRDITATRLMRRALLQWQQIEFKIGHLIPRIRAVSLQLAFLLVTLVAGGNIVIQHLDNSQRDMMAGWAARSANLLPGNSPVAVVSPVPNSPLERDRQLVGNNRLTKISIVSFNYKSGTDEALPVAGLRAIMAFGQVPLVTLDLSSGAMTEAAVRKMARQAAALPGPILLRPILASATPAEYRQRWRYMVELFTQQKATNVNWVWTPPYQDSVATYSPGAPYIDWIAAEVQVANASRVVIPSSKKPYTILRRNLASRIDLHYKPVLLINQPIVTKEISATSQYLMRQYPEVRAVIGYAGFGQLVTPDASELMARAISSKKEKGLL
ncbi:glycosyltransferase [Hymenobacter sp. DG25B]|uniref:glycosyltransferase n=1 Tax=Hymenobacter sp. DG25B TaxID=1385664 RepID=UPI0012E05E21|nr:cellulose synthase catalytic subunit [Hymenobacter sp. DG25B]